MTNPSMLIRLTLLCSTALMLSAACAEKDACLGSGPSTPKKYEDCDRLCNQGNTKACDRRSEVQGELHTLCHLRSNKSACRALCHGHQRDQLACRKLSER